MTSIAGQLVTEALEYDGGRPVTVYIPPDSPQGIVFAGDGQLISRWGGVLEATDVPPTMIVGAHRLDDETLRLQEYSPGFPPSWARGSRAPPTTPLAVRSRSPTAPASTTTPLSRTPSTPPPPTRSSTASAPPASSPQASAQWPRSAAWCYSQPIPKPG